MRAAVEALSPQHLGVEFRVIRVPFFLEPRYIDYPPEFRESHEERMVRKFGSKQAFDRVKAAHGLIPRGAEVGLDASVGFTQEQLDKRIQSSTLNSHKLVLFTTQKHGSAVAESLYDQLNTRHFLQGGVLNDKTLLQESVAALGLGQEHTAELLAFVADDEWGKEETLYLYEQTQRLGIDSIPTLVIDGQYLVSGAAGAVEIQEAIAAALNAPGGVTGQLAFDRRVIA